MTALARVMTANAAGVDDPKRVYLHPGQTFTTSETVLVSTILGSCVAVCLWDPFARVAGMNHYLLPSGPQDARYGNRATELLLEAVLAKGAILNRLVAKVFGGACVIAGFTGSRQAIGAQNVAMAREVLARRGISIQAEQTGGNRGRKLLFHTGTGVAYVKEI
jgi:chemotaxis protein CheD